MEKEKQLKPIAEAEFEKLERQMQAEVGSRFDESDRDIFLNLFANGFLAGLNAVQLGVHDLAMDTMPIFQELGRRQKAAAKTKLN